MGNVAPPRITTIAGVRGAEATYAPRISSGRRDHAVTAGPPAQGFGEVETADPRGAVEIGEGARDLEDAVIGAGGKPEFLGRLGEELGPTGIGAGSSMLSR